MTLVDRGDDDGWTPREVVAEHLERFPVERREYYN